MHTATLVNTKDDGDVIQTTYELSKPFSYKRWNGERAKTEYVVISHSSFGGANETAVFPGTLEGNLKSHTELFVATPMCDDRDALGALGYSVA